jgi:hypothetical protein
MQKKNAKGIIKRINKAKIMAHRHIIWPYTSPSPPSPPSDNWQLASVFPLHGEKKELEKRYKEGVQNHR